MADLITQARAKYEFGGALGAANTALNAAEDTTIDAIISACSEAAIKYCGRDFNSTTYDETYDNDRLGLIVLNQYPMISITSLRADPTPVIEIKQTDTVTNQYATISPVALGLSLSRTASGVTTTVTTGLTYAANVTIDQMVAAILGLVATTLPGWTARALSPFGLFPSVDLYQTGTQIVAINARGIYATLQLHVANLENYRINSPSGSLQPGHKAWLGWGDSCYAQGSYRIKYIAGYATIPLDLQSAIAQWVCAVFYKTKERDPNAGNTFSSSVGKSFVDLEKNMPPFTRSILNSHKSRRISRRA